MSLPFENDSFDAACRGRQASNLSGQYSGTGSGLSALRNRLAATAGEAPIDRWVFEDGVVTDAAGAIIAPFPGFGERSQREPG